MLSTLALLAAPLLLQEEAAERPPTGRATVYHVDSVEALDGETHENVSLLVRDGVIERLGRALIVPDHAEVVDLRGGGSVATPPLVLSHANFLVDDRRGGGNHSRFVAADSLWLDEDWAEELWEEGVLLVAVDPPGGNLPGRTSVLLVDGEAPQPDPEVRDLHLKVEVGASRSAKRTLRRAFDGAEKAIEKEKQARAEWEKARQEWEEKQKQKEKEKEKEEKKEGESGDGNGGNGGGGDGAAQDGGGNDEGNGKGDGKGKQEDKEPPKEFEPPEIDPNLRAVVDWVRQERLAQIWLRSAADWLHWQDVREERELPYEIVLDHGRSTNLHEVAEALADSGVRVYAPARIAFLPYTRVRVNLPAELHRAGVEKLALRPEREDLRGLREWRTQVAMLVREGLDREVALRGMTLEPAAAIGQEELVQPLAAGAAANFVIWDGDPLAPMSQARLVVSDGDVVYDREEAEEEEQR